MRDAAYWQHSQPPPGVAPHLRNIFRTPIVAGSFDARCCLGYWIKVPGFAEKIISRGRPKLLLPLARFFSTPLHSFASATPFLGVTARKKLTIAAPYRFSRLVVFLCRQNGQRRHLALNIYGKVPFSRNGETLPSFLIPSCPCRLRGEDIRAKRRRVSLYRNKEPGDGEGFPDDEGVRANSI